MKDFINFLENSPTAYHAVESIDTYFTKNQFHQIDEASYWSLKPGNKYFLKRNNSSLCAFITPKKPPRSVRLVASHTDSPGLKLKPSPEIKKNGAVLFECEIYGAPLLTSWLNRDLGLAGRILYIDSKNHPKEQLVRLEDFPLTIPQLAIHLDREVNEKGLLLNKQDHLNVLLGLSSSFKEGDSALENLLRNHIKFKEIIDHDLFLYPTEKPALIGYKHSLLASYRLDSLSSVYAGMKSLAEESSPLEDTVKMVIFWDNEEIGSNSAQGASSPFLTQILERIVNSYQATREDYFCFLNRSICISVDLAHALHPNYAEKHDPNHQPILGGGTVIKSNAQQRYATNLRSLFPIDRIAKKAGLNIQRFVSRNDMPCGSTIGPIQSTVSGIPTLDIGSPQLSMHGCRELMACKDHLDMCRLLRCVFQAEEWPSILHI